MTYLVRFDRPAELWCQEDIGLLWWVSHIDQHAALSVWLVHGVIGVTAAAGRVLLLLELTGS